MFIKQLSIFVENKTGRLQNIVDTLSENNINISALSIADTTEFGILRLIVNDAKRARDILYAEGFSSMLTDVLIIKVPHAPGSLQKILELIAEKDVNIEYMYGLSVEAEDASIVLKTNDLEVACEVLKAANIGTMTDDEIATL